jgi:hypothetical protein
MSLAEGLVAMIGEGSAYVIGRVVGRRFALDKKQAQRIGEYIVIAFFVFLIFIVTVVYS